MIALAYDIQYFNQHTRALISHHLSSLSKGDVLLGGFDKTEDK